MDYNRVRYWWRQLVTDFYPHLFNNFSIIFSWFFVIHTCLFVLTLASPFISGCLQFYNGVCSYFCHTLVLPLYSGIWIGLNGPVLLEMVWKMLPGWSMYCFVTIPLLFPQLKRPLHRRQNNILQHNIFTHYDYSDISIKAWNCIELWYGCKS